MRRYVPRGFAAVALAAALSLTVAGAAVAAPANDDFPGTTIGPGLPVDVNGTTDDATAQMDEPGHPAVGGSAAATVWYQWTASATETVVFDACGLTRRHVVDVFTGDTLATLTPLSTDSFGCKLIVPVTTGVGYKVRIEGFDSATAFNLEIRPPAFPANDAFASPVTLPAAAPFSVAGTTIDGTQEAGEPSDLPEVHLFINGGSVWYSWTPSASGQVTLDTCMSDTGRDPGSDPVLTVWQGAQLNALTLVASNDDGDPDCVPNDLGSRLTMNAVAGTSYRIAVSALYNGGDGAFTLRATCPACPAVVPPAPVTPKCKKGQTLKKGKCVKAKKKKKRKPKKK